MIEIPESATIGKQASETLKGKRIAHVIESNSPHRFTFYNGDPAEYSNRLVGRTVLGAQGYGAFVDILMDADTHLLIGDGTNMRYYTSAEKAPKKYQLMIVFEDDSFLAFTVSMYGSIYAFKGEFDNPYYQGSIHKLCPLDERFDKAISLVSSGISRKIYPQKRCSPPSKYSGPGQRSLPRYLVQCPDLPETKNIDFIRRGYRPPLQHREIHAGRDDSPRRPGYGEGSIRRLRQLPHDPIEEHLP